MSKHVPPSTAVGLGGDLNWKQGHCHGSAGIGDITLCYTMMPVGLDSHTNARCKTLFKEKKRLLKRHNWTRALLCGWMKPLTALRDWPKLNWGSPETGPKSVSGACRTPSFSAAAEEQKGQRWTPGRRTTFGLNIQQSVNHCLSRSEATTHQQSATI